MGYFGETLLTVQKFSKYKIQRIQKNTKENNQNYCRMQKQRLM
jgi:hypothetical protein